MNYPKLYNKLIANAQSQKRVRGDVYYESHHIVPKCKGGSNRSENRVFLTAREHFIAHWILYRIYPTDRAIIAAFKVMFAKGRTGNRYVPSSRAYEESKIAFSESQKGEKNHRYGKPSHNKGVSFSAESRKRMSEAQKGAGRGRVLSLETRKKMSLAKEGSTRVSCRKPIMATNDRGETHRFNSLKEMAQKYKMYTANITHCLKGRKQRLKGWHSFKYETIKDSL